MTDEVTVKRGSGVDRAGAPTGVTTVTLRCRVERKIRRVVSHFVGATGRFGEETLSDTSLVTMQEVLPTDVIILPGETRERSVLSIESAGTPAQRGGKLYRVSL